MPRHGKHYTKAIKTLDQTKVYSVDEAIASLKKVAYAKFDESFELTVNCKLEKKHTVRSTIMLPNSFGKEKKVLVFAKGDKADQAKANGADYVGADDYIEKIKGGWLDFDACVATADMMKDISKIARILGPKGLMPNPKTGTVTDNVVQAVKEIKQGKIEYKADKSGVISVAVAKKSMSDNLVKDNLLAVYKDILKKRPSDLKGDYVIDVYLSMTMTPSLLLDHASILQVKQVTIPEKELNNGTKSDY